MKAQNKRRIKKQATKTDLTATAEAGDA